MIEGKVLPTRTGMVFATDLETGQIVCLDQGRETDPRDARIAELEAECRELKMQALADVGQWQEAAERVGSLERANAVQYEQAQSLGRDFIAARDLARKLEAELAGWQRVAVEAVIPLEAMLASGTMNLHSTMTQAEIVNAVTIVRRAVSGKGLPPPPTPRSLSEGEMP